MIQIPIDVFGNALIMRPNKIIWTFMKNLIKKSLFLSLITVSLACCATILTGTTQNINVQVLDADTNEVIPEVKCSVHDGKGIYYPLHSNPASITVTKGNGALNPMCKKPGYTQKSFGMGESFNAITIINVLFWPGFIVDAVTGSIKDYPSHMTIFMERRTAAARSTD